MNSRSKVLLESLDIDVAPTTLLDECSIAIQQMIAIARAVDMECKVLILDEPTSSLDEEEVEKLFVLMKKLKAKGVGFVDAPVSGGEPGAVAGTLAIMAGGDQKDFDAMKEYFDILGSSALLIGGSGSGSVTKLANQVIVNNTIAVVSEAFVLATKAGADPEKVYHAIRGGLAGSAVLDAKIPMIIERNFKPGGPIRINHKDIKNVVNTAHSIDVPIPYTAQLYEILQTLKIHGHMNDDHGGIVQYFEKLADVEVKKTEE